MEPLVSIVIPVYNGEDYVGEAVESALHQTYGNIEILVVNDGSTDRTEEIVKAYGDRVRYFYKPNGGVASALNLGIREMKGEYFSWLSHDDYDYPEKIKMLVKAVLEQGDGETAAYCDFTLLDQKTGFLSPYRMEEYFSEKTRSIAMFMMLHGRMDGCTMLIPVSLLRRAGGFDEKLRTTQDYDMWFRMLRGKRIIHVPKVLHVSRVHERQGSQTMKEFPVEQEQLFLRFLRELSTEEMREIWGSEYCCLQSFLSYFEDRGMAASCKYVRGRMEQYDEPKAAVQLRRQAAEEIFILGGQRAKRLVIFGAGDYGRRVWRLLNSRDIEVNAFWDNDPQKWGTNIEGMKCISVDEGLMDSEQTLVILAAELYGGMLRQLEGKRTAGWITKMHLEGRLYDVPGIRRIGFE